MARGGMLGKLAVALADVVTNAPGTVTGFERKRIQDIIGGVVDAVSGTFTTVNATTVTASGAVTTNTLSATGAITSGTNITATGTINADNMGSRALLLTGQAGNMLVIKPNVDSPGAAVAYGTNAAGNTALWQIHQNGRFVGTADALTAGTPDKAKLDDSYSTAHIAYNTANTANATANAAWNHASVVGQVVGNTLAVDAYIPENTWTNALTLVVPAGFWIISAAAQIDGGNTAICRFMNISANAVLQEITLGGSGLRVAAWAHDLVQLGSGSNTFAIQCSSYSGGSWVKGSNSFGGVMHTVMRAVRIG